MIDKTILSKKIVLLENFDVRVYNNRWQIHAEGDEICIIDRAIAGVSRPSREAMAVIPTTVEFVHCELGAIYFKDLLRCHTGSLLDQFVSQSHRYRRSSSSRDSLLEPEKSSYERCDWYDVASSFWTAPSSEASGALHLSLLVCHSCQNAFDQVSSYMNLNLSSNTCISRCFLP